MEFIISIVLSLAISWVFNKIVYGDQNKKIMEYNREIEMRYQAAYTGYEKSLAKQREAMVKVVDGFNSTIHRLETEINGEPQPVKKKNNLRLV